MLNVLITGSNRGIGREMIKAFASNGNNVIAHARKQTPEFEEYLTQMAEDYSIEVIPIYFDMLDTDEMKSSIKSLLKTYQVDVLINNAGIAHGGLFQMTSMNDIQAIFDVNLFAPMQLTQLLLRQMVRRGNGSIINIASISGLDSKPGNCAYGTSKAAIIAWTRTLASELGQFGIRVNAIAPGLTDTDMAKQMENQAGISMIRSSAMNRLAIPSEIASVALFLASDASSFINGQGIRGDGGEI